MYKKNQQYNQLNHFMNAKKRHEQYYLTLIRTYDHSQSYDTTTLEFGQVESIFKEALQQEDIFYACELLEICSGFFVRTGLNQEYVNWGKTINKQLNSNTSSLIHTTIKKHLGRAHRHALGINSVENLKRAIQYYQKALTYLNPQKEPIKYAEIFYNIGNVYRTLAEVEFKQKNLYLALQFCNTALVYLCPDTAQLLYAKVRHTRGLTYCCLAGIENKREHLQLAIKEQQIALQYRVEQFPVDHAITLCHIGVAWYHFASIEAPKQNLRRALYYVRIALKYITELSGGNAYGGINRHLGNVYRNLGKQTGTFKYYSLALTSYERAKKVYCPIRTPINYAQLLEDIALYYFYLNKKDLASKFWQDAIQIYDRLDSGQNINRIQNFMSACTKCYSTWQS